MDKDLNVKNETIQLLEEDIGEELPDISVVVCFSKLPIAQRIKPKNRQEEYPN